MICYNTFVHSNTSPDLSNLSDLFHLLGQPVRLQILLIIADSEACVCHMEALLGIRQAVISQHLMILRKAGLVTTTRYGRNIFYRLTGSEMYRAIGQFAALAGLPADELSRLASRPAADCPCPRCNPGLDPALSCQKH